MLCPTLTYLNSPWPDCYHYQVSLGEEESESWRLLVSSRSAGLIGPYQDGLYRALSEILGECIQLCKIHQLDMSLPDNILPFMPRVGRLSTVNANQV
jgi:hypothetical protein